MNIQELMKFGWQTDETIPESLQHPPPTARHVVRVEFDGGTPCNIPAKGYGDGYGSYQISYCGHTRPITRLDFARPMSANVAEITTLLYALKTVVRTFDASQTWVHVHGDSIIALHRCTISVKKWKRTSPEFMEAAQQLFDRCKQFLGVSTHWRGRAASVKLFGH